MRTGHETVGRLVSVAESRGCRLSDLAIEDFQSACDRVDEQVYEVLGTQNAVNVLCSEGSGGRASVDAQYQQWCVRLGIDDA